MVFSDHAYPGTREGVILVVEIPPIAFDPSVPPLPEIDEVIANGDVALRSGAAPGPASDGNGELRRAELADFLRKRRALLKPDDVGLAGGGRRRTPGLRREEVAALAGVGTTWYTWLEQGRDVRASLEVLEAISRALRLTSAERTHLVLLGRGEEPPPCKTAERVSGTVKRLIENLGPNPAYVIGRRWDYLAWNRAATLLLGDLAEVPKASRNHVWLHFMDPSRRELFPDWAQGTRLLVAKFRADSAHHIGDPEFEQLITSLRKSSPEFCKAWKKHEVSRASVGRREIRHPVAGTMVFEHAVFTPGESPEQRMVLYSPLPEHDTPAKLAQLLDES